jgi:hypothetical protein
LAAANTLREKSWAFAERHLGPAGLRIDLSYADLAQRMDAIGLKGNDRTLANKIATGSFFAVFSFNAWRRSASRTCPLTPATSHWLSIRKGSTFSQRSVGLILSEKTAAYIIILIL